jgi:hypothetical protein
MNAGLLEIQKLCGIPASEHRRFITADEQDGPLLLSRSKTFAQTLKNLPPFLQGWRVRIRIDIQNEHFFVTLLIDQERPEGSHEAICAIEKTLADKEARNGADNSGKQWTDFFGTYYETLWRRLDNEFLKPAFDKFPGKRFTEFRGIVLRDVENNLCRRAPNSIAAPKETLVLPGNDEREASRQSLRDWITRNESFLNEIMQIVRSSKDNDRDANCVLSEVLDGMGVYASSVRPTVVSSETDVRKEEITPLRYFILYNGLSRYQLGRLVRLTHRLGELRCAAVLDHRSLLKASTRIRTLGNLVDKYLRDKQGTLDDLQLREALIQMNEIASSNIPGGLIHRINRSRLYSTTFRQAMEDMRAKRIEGWQSYEAFFRRNLYPMFEQISQIGHRYAALADRINRLTVARNTTGMRELVEAILRIQKLADVIGIAAFTYYIGHILAKGIRLMSEPTFLHKVLADHDLSDFFGHMIALGVALLFWWNMHMKRAHKTEPQTAATSS